MRPSATIREGPAATLISRAVFLIRLPSVATYAYWPISKTGPCKGHYVTFTLLDVCYNSHCSSGEYPSNQYPREYTKLDLLFHIAIDHWTNDQPMPRHRNSLRSRVIADLIVKTLFHGPECRNHIQLNKTSFAFEFRFGFWRNNKGIIRRDMKCMNHQGAKKYLVNFTIIIIYKTNK